MEVITGVLQKKPKAANEELLEDLNKLSADWKFMIDGFFKLIEKGF